MGLERIEGDRRKWSTDGCVVDTGSRVIDPGWNHFQLDYRWQWALTAQGHGEQTVIATFGCILCRSDRYLAAFIVEDQPSVLLGYWIDDYAGSTRHTEDLNCYGLSAFEQAIVIYAGCIDDNSNRLGCGACRNRGCSC